MNNLHYPSLELCKKLTESGFPETENSHFEHVDDVTWEGIYPRIPGKNRREYNEYACPSIAELLDEFPTLKYLSILQTQDDETDGHWYMLEYRFLKNIKRVQGNILPNALAEMWLWLKENNYLPN